MNVSGAGQPLPHLPKNVFTFIFPISFQRNSLIYAPSAQGTGKLAVRPRQAVAVRRPLESPPLLPDPRFLGVALQGIYIIMDSKA